MIAKMSAMKTPERSNKVYLSDNKADICDKNRSVDQKASFNLLSFFSLN